MIQNCFPGGNMELTEKQKTIHRKALALADNYREVEGKLILVLQQVEETRLYKQLGKASLFTYATQVLGFSESVAYSFISVARKAKQFPELKAAVVSKQLSVSKASR